MARHRAATTTQEWQEAKSQVERQTGRPTNRLMQAISIDYRVQTKCRLIRGCYEIVHLVRDQVERLIGLSFCPFEGSSSCHSVLVCPMWLSHV